jgi:hypothetical protein
MRGVRVEELTPALPLDDEPPALPGNAEELQEPQELDDDEKLDALPLPDNVEEDPETGVWTYTLQHELRPGKPLPAGFTKIKVPAVIYARDIRNSGMGRNADEVVFYMLCSMTGVSPAVMDRLDARDYTVLSQLLNRRALKNSRAVLRALQKKDG